MLEPTTPRVEAVAGVRPRVLRIDDMCRLTGLARSTIYQWTREGRFPKPRSPYGGARVAVYLVDEVEAWLDRHIGADDDAAA